MIHKLAGAKILLISDDVESGQVWTFTLERRGAEATFVSLDGSIKEEAVQGYDLVVIDVEGDPNRAFNLCQLLRAELVNPIILVTYEHDEPSLLKAYQAGADDCLQKPIGLGLFMAKLAVWLRRSFTVPADSLNSLQAGSLTLDPVRRQLVHYAGEVARLTGLEFRLLNLLMNNPGMTMSGDLIVDRVWGHNGEGDSVLLKNLICRLRRKMQTLPDSEECIETVPGEGY